MPVNLGLQASARTDVAGFADGVIASGAIGLKVHEDWGASARIIDATLTTADAFDVAVCLHTDGLNESGELEETVAAIAGRTIHAYHVEGVGGGHIPDLIGIVREPNVICSSTTPGLPYGRATAAEHEDMILIVHEGNPRLAGGRRGGARADPPRDDGGRGTAARPRRDLDHQQRLAGDGPDRRDHPPHLAARPRDEARGAPRTRGPAGPTNRPTTTSGSSATWPRSPSSRRASTGSARRSGRSRPVIWPTWSCGTPPRSARNRWRS